MFRGNTNIGTNYENTSPLKLVLPIPGWYLNLAVTVTLHPSAQVIFVLFATLSEDSAATMKRTKDEDKEEAPAQPAAHNSSAGSNGHEATSPVATTASAATSSAAVSDASIPGASVRTTGRVKVSVACISATVNTPAHHPSICCRNPSRCTIPRTTMCPGPAVAIPLAEQRHLQPLLLLLRPPAMSSHHLPT